MRGRPGIAALALLASAAGATAQDGGARGPFTGKTEACFRRSYDKAYLARQPEQRVATIALIRGPTELKREAIDGPEAPSLALALSVRAVGGRRAGPEPLDCHSRRASEGEHGRDFLVCVSACGRGALDLVPDGLDRLTVRIGGTVQGRFIADAIGPGRRCDRDDDVVWLGDADGDRVFVLERAPMKECRR